MPRTKRIEKEDILRAAVQVVRTQGEGALSVRGIAKELGCSTQPLYSEFGSMEELRATLLDYLRRHYLHVQCRNYKEFAAGRTAALRRMTPTTMRRYACWYATWKCLPRPPGPCTARCSIAATGWASCWPPATAP